MVTAIGAGIDLARTEQALENALSFMRNRFRPGRIPGAGGWYHQLDAPVPGPTATAVGLDMFQRVGAPFDHVGDCLGFLRERQVRSADPRVNGGWSTNTSLGHPVMEATGWVAYVLGTARTGLVTGGPDARAAYEWLVHNQNTDGGWGSLAGCPSRVWLTCLGLRALHQLNPYADAIATGLEWLMAARGESGGWGETPGRPPTVTHTSFVLLTTLELRPRWHDSRTLPAFEWLTAHLDTSRLDDRDARVESYNTSLLDESGAPVVWQTVMPHYGLAFAASALLRHPGGAPAELIADAYGTITSGQLPSGAWPNVHGGSGESIWSVAPFVNALCDVRRVSPAMSSDQILWSPSLVVIQRADAGDQPLTAIVRARPGPVRPRIRPPLVRGPALPVRAPRHPAGGTGQVLLEGFHARPHPPPGAVRHGAVQESAHDLRGSSLDDLGCTFCQVLATGSPTAEYVEMARSATTLRPVRQHWFAGRCLLLAEVAPLSAGHVLVIPHPHILAAALLPPAETARFGEMCREVGLRLAAHFGHDSYLAFEHGTGRTGALLPRRVKCAPTEHAHVHILPNSVGPGVLGLLEQYTKADGYHGIPLEPADWNTRRAALEERGSSYHSFTVGTHGGEHGILFRPPDGALPSQYFRRFVAHCAQGSSEAFSVRSDWRDEVVFADDTVLRDIAETALFLEAGEWRESPSAHGSRDTARPGETGRTSTLTPTPGHEQGR